MTIATSTHPFVRELIAALGLTNVRSLEIRIAMNEAVTVKAEFLATDAIAPVFKRYRLHPEQVDDVCPR